MKKLFTVFALVVSLILSASGTQTAQAAMMDHVKIKGQVVGMNKTVVTMQTTQGNIKIPRRFFNEQEGVRIKVGRVMTVTTSLTDVVALNSKK